MPDPLWYYYQDNAQQGPLTLEALRALADQGKLRPDTLVTRIGMTDWLPARLVPELFPQESAMRPPLPPGVGPRRDVLAAGRKLAERLHQGERRHRDVRGGAHQRGPGDHGERQRPDASRPAGRVHRHLPGASGDADHQRDPGIDRGKYPFGAHVQLQLHPLVNYHRQYGDHLPAR